MVYHCTIQSVTFSSLLVGVLPVSKLEVELPTFIRDVHSCQVVIEVFLACCWHLGILLILDEEICLRGTNPKNLRHNHQRLLYKYDLLAHRSFLLLLHRVILYDSQTFTL